MQGEGTSPEPDRSAQRDSSVGWHPGFGVGLVLAVLFVGALVLGNMKCRR